MREPFFSAPSSRTEPIYDARQGFWDNQNECLRAASIKSCGFELLALDGEDVDIISDWSQMDDVKSLYLPLVQRMIEQAYPNQPISYILFWNPVMRSRDAEQTRDGKATPTAGYAALPHIDLDVNAYNSTFDLVQLFQKNHFGLSSFPTRAVEDAIERGCRFSVVNAWRSIGQDPVENHHLAFLSTRYTSGQLPFPHSQPNMDLSRWYTYPSMTSKEVLLFCQYDRDLRQPSDLWHCAITPSPPPQNKGRLSNEEYCRRSFDVRCLIIFENKVEDEFNRFCKDRPKTILNMEGSQVFCSRQSQKFRRQSHQ